jgi:hypothetical protein
MARWISLAFNRASRVSSKARGDNIMNRADRRIATGKNKRFSDMPGITKEQYAAYLAMLLKQEEINHGV